MSSSWQRPAWAIAYLAVVGAATLAAIGLLLTNGVVVGFMWPLEWLLIVPVIFPCIACARSSATGWAAVVDRTGFMFSALAAVGLVLAGLHVEVPGVSNKSGTAIWATSLLLGLSTLLRGLPASLRWLGGAAVALGALAAIGWMFEVFGSIAGPMPLLIVVPTLLVAAIAVSLPATLRLYQDGRNEEASINRAALAIACPRCARIQRMRCPGGSCEECGLVIRVDVDEPRCACGYLLFGIASDVCPECGRDIRGKSWPATPTLAIDAV